MERNEPLTGVPLDEVALDLNELAHACNVEPEWVLRHVQAGVLGGGADVQAASWRFHSGDLVRARRLARIERDFDANEELAALVADLVEELGRLHERMRVLGLE